MARKIIERVETHRLEQVFLSVEEHIAYLTLHNPPVNIISIVMQEEILLLCDYINHDDDIWVCVMHSDLKTFCVGADIHRFSQSIPGEDITGPQKVYYDGAQALYDLRVPLICAVHGHCVGGGLCYSAGADISIAVKDTLFGAPEAKLCVVGGSGHLSRLLPPQIMRDMCYCASFITAEELHSKYGGVTVVVDTPEELMPAAEAKARELCKRGPLVLRYLKACMNEQEDLQMHRKNELELSYTRRMTRYTDFKEGVSAFLEKRDPEYSGR
ncbi:enoyl-CoA hydratase/isomerase family protein [Oscillibacter sp. GMB15532]|uniref:enoyl-CoA hydratase/isomerase family protein n=1 Tax=Oscillibacter sp. GMB15532 TaxID=3230022 RepID=UPI0034DFF0EF